MSQTTSKTASQTGQICNNSDEGFLSYSLNVNGINSLFTEQENFDLESYDLSLLSANGEKVYNFYTASSEEESYHMNSGNE